MNILAAIFQYKRMRRAAYDHVRRSKVVNLRVADVVAWLGSRFPDYPEGDLKTAVMDALDVKPRRRRAV